MKISYSGTIDRWLRASFGSRNLMPHFKAFQRIAKKTNTLCCRGAVCLYPRAIGAAILTGLQLSKLHEGHTLHSFLTSSQLVSSLVGSSSTALSSLGRNDSYSALNDATSFLHLPITIQRTCQHLVFCSNRIIQPRAHAVQ